MPTPRAHSRTRSAARLLAGVVVAAAAAWPTSVLAQGCAMCGTALHDDPLGRAISWSVLFLIAAPYTIVGTVGGWLYYSHRHATGRRRAAVIPLARAEPAGGHPEPADGPQGDQP
jgi:hypothetical protein